MAESENKVICIVDTSLLLFGTLIPRKEIEYITSPKVVEEIYKTDLKREIVEGYIANNRLRVEKPDDKFLEKAENVAREIGELSKLSQADVDILALAIKYSGRHRVIVFTDDYSIQNILENLGIEYRPIRRKIKERVSRWRFRCKKCGEKYQNDIQICPICGGEVIRRRERA